jgi:hypothetical protein
MDVAFGTLFVRGESIYASSPGHLAWILLTARELGPQRLEVGMTSC